MTRNSAIVTLLEWLERSAFNRLDHIITLSQAMIDRVKSP